MSPAEAPAAAPTDPRGLTSPVRQARAPRAQRRGGASRVRKMRSASRPLLLSAVLTLLVGRWRCQAGSERDAPNRVVKQVWAVEGEDVELPCNLTPNDHTHDKVSMVLWFKDDAGIPLYNLDARGGDLYKAIHWTMSGSLGNRTYFQVDNGSGLARLKIKAVTYEDQGTFRCRVDFTNSPTNNFRVNLTLIEPPTKPVIYDAQGREVTGVGGPFLEGYDLLLTCQVSGGRPRPTVTWWQGEEMLDGVMEEPMMLGLASKFSVNRLFIGRVTRSLWGTKLECRAESRAKDKFKMAVRKVPLDIYLKPAMVNVALAEEPIYAGRPMSARCETWGSSPAARLVWRLGGLVIRESSLVVAQRSNGTGSKLALTLDKSDDGKELTCRAENPRFPGGVLEKTRVLRVLYPPTASVDLASGFNMDTLREGDDVKFICNYQSNPEPTSIEWLHNGLRLMHDVGAGVLLASSTLTIRVLTLAHDGDYSCVVRNAVGEAESIALNVRMKYTPRCRLGHEWQEIIAAAGELLRLHCEVEADPREGVRYSWTRNSSLGDVFAVPHLRPLSGSLEYTPRADEDFGTLACWASNSVGRQKSPCIFNIMPAKPPDRPVDCSVRNDSSAMEVNCIPGSSGGLPQYFVLEVRGALENQSLLQQMPQSDQGIASQGESLTAAGGADGPAIYQDRSDEPSFQLYGLPPGRGYTIAVYAENSRGRSPPVLIENVRVAEPRRGGPAERRFLGDLASVIPQAAGAGEALVVVGLVVAVSLILVGVGVAIGLAICRRRSSPPATEGPDDFTTPTYVSAQRIEPRIRYGNNDRRRSQRASLYLEDSRNEPDLLQQVDIDLH